MRIDSALKLYAVEIICWPSALTPTSPLLMFVHLLLINSVEMADRKIQMENHMLEALSIYDKAIAYYPAYPRALLRKAQLYVLS